MIDVQTKVTIDGAEFQAELGTIASTMLGIEDHGIFTFALDFRFAGSGQGAGTTVLDVWDEDEQKRVGTAVGMDLIMQVLRVAGVRKWEDLKGRQLMVLREDRWSTIRGLLNPQTEEYLIFKDHYKKWGYGH